jgi:ferric-dicitrate binding protein FerR (iron transport regulator)
MKREAGGVAAAPMSKKPFTPEQRGRRRAYLKAWRAEHREHCTAYDKSQRQKRREQRRADHARWPKPGGAATMLVAGSPASSAGIGCG